MRTALAACALSLGAAGARADIANWIWMVSDTGDADGIIEPGESALLTLFMAFDPPQWRDGAFSEAGPYDILGDQTWARGTIDDYDMRLDWFSTDPVIDGENNILQVSHFQLARVWGDDYDTSNPIDLFFIQWTPGSYAHATVTLDNGGPEAWIYTNAFGERLLYAGEGGAVSFDVVPAGPSAAVGFAALALATRRRR